MPITIVFSTGHIVDKYIKEKRAAQVQKYPYRYPESGMIINIACLIAFRMIVKEKKNINK